MAEVLDETLESLRFAPEDRARQLDLVLSVQTSIVAWRVEEQIDELIRQHIAAKSALAVDVCAAIEK
jgi:hypothetical protein